MFVHRQSTFASFCGNLPFFLKNRPTFWVQRSDKVASKNASSLSRLICNSVLLKDSDYQLTGSTAGTPLTAQNTLESLPASTLANQQTNHVQALPTYTPSDYNNYPTLPVSIQLSTISIGVSWLRKDLIFL